MESFVETSGESCSGRIDAARRRRDLRKNERETDGRFVIDVVYVGAAINDYVRATMRTKRRKHINLIIVTIDII